MNRIRRKRKENQLMNILECNLDDLYNSNKRTKKKKHLIHKSSSHLYCVLVILSFQFYVSIVDEQTNKNLGIMEYFNADFQILVKKESIKILAYKQTLKIINSTFFLSGVKTTLKIIAFLMLILLPSFKIIVIILQRRTTIFLLILQLFLFTLYILVSYKLQFYQICIKFKCIFQKEPNNFIIINYLFIKTYLI